MTDETQKIDLPMEATPENSLSEEDFNVAYFVGIGKDGNVVFRTMGATQSLVGLKSLHYLAASRIDEVELQAKDRHQTSVTKMLQLLNNNLQSINGQLGFLNDKIDKLNKVESCACPKNTETPMFDCAP